MKSLKITTKMLLLLIIAVIPFNILSLWISHLLIQDATDSVEKSIRSTITTFSNRTTLTVENTEYFFYQIQHTNVDGSIFFHNDNDLSYQLAKNQVAQTISDKRIGSALADYFVFYRSDLDDFFVVPHNNHIFDTILFDHNYFNPENVYQNSGWHLITIEDEPYLFRIMLDDTMYFGAFISLSEIHKNIDTYLDYSLEQIQFTETPPTAFDANGFCVTEKYQDLPLYVTLTFSHSILSFIPLQRWILYLAIVTYILLIPVLYHFMKKWLIQPLQTLNQAHAHLSTGDQNYRILSSASSHEFQAAYNSFNDMADNLQLLRLENINKELRYKQMLLENLQLQIRPHFLLNYFNLLFTVVQAGKNDLAKKTILYLSQYLRYLFQYDQALVLFAKELQLIEQFLEVAAIQYPNSFTFSYESDPEVNLCRIPPLLIHNFIENVVSHALIHNQIIHISLYCFYEKGLVTFQIADDGRGMDPETVQQINSGNFADYKKGKHLGIRNSLKRLQFFYDGKATVHVDSTLNQGTIFTITIPYNLDVEEDADETTNCK